MFVGVQKLKLFSEQKSFESRQILDVAGLHHLSYSGFASRNGFEAIFLANPSLVVN